MVSLWRSLFIGDLDGPERIFMKLHTNDEINREKAILVALELPGETWDIEESLKELAALVDTAGGEVLTTFQQKRPHPDSAFYIGKGKAEEVGRFCDEVGADILVFNDSLSPSQLRNLSEMTECRVLDRNQLILDIFAQRANSAEGKLQVELAQLKYTLPRLSGMGKSLSRLGGGIGTRGPGESKLEQDRRHVRSRIDLLEKEIEEVAKRRLITKGSRQRSGMPMVALVGYTNAGKSSILNWICDANEVAENQLFATLDSVTRLFKLSNKREVLLTDTVGFIHKLPHQLVAAFRSTLDELKDAELLLHIVDISDANYEEQIQTTMSLLEELEVQQPIIRVFNKIDALPTLGVLQRAMSTCENAVAVSVVENKGKEALLQAIQDHFAQERMMYRLLIPYEKGELLKLVYQQATILERSEEETGVSFLLESKSDLKERLQSKLGFTSEEKNESN